MYPWQDRDEWLLLLAASRYEHEGFTAIRPAAALTPAGTVDGGGPAAGTATIQELTR